MKVLRVLAIALAASLPTWGALAPAFAADPLEAETDEGETGPAAAAGEADAETAPAPAARRGEEIERIVVTARRREELLEDTPVSVTALGQQQLLEAGATRLDDIQELVPNFQFQSDNGQDARLFIRGVGVGSEVATFDPGVGIYVDGIYLARSQGSVLDLIDFESIQVLRGPQGTLFGRNTAGGAVVITTTKPHEEFEAFTQFRIGSRELYESRATVNLPIKFGIFEDKLFTRFTWGSSDFGGFGINHATGAQYSDKEMRGGMGSLRFLATDDVTLDVASSYTSNDSNGRTKQCVLSGQAGLFSQTIINLFNNRTPGDPTFHERCAASEPLQFSELAGVKNGVTPYDPEDGIFGNGLSKTDAYGTWGTITWDIGELGLVDELTLKSISGWREQKVEERLDVDGTTDAVGYNGFAGGLPVQSGNPVSYDGRGGKFTQYSQELQALMEFWEGKGTLVTGAYGFYEDSKLSDARFFFPTIAIAQVNGSATTQVTKTRNWSVAGFGQLELNPLDWLQLTAGLRFTHEERRFERQVCLPPQGAMAGDPMCTDPANLAADADQTESFDAWTPMGSILVRLPEDWIVDAGLPIDQMNFYFTYSRGFKSGGFNGGFLGISGDADLRANLEPFDPEKLDAFEWGIKSTWFERKLTFNINGFYSDYKDFQDEVIVPVPGMMGTSSFANVVRNAGNVEIWGMEAELVARPITGFTVTGGVGLTDAVFADYDDATSGVVEDPSNSQDPATFSGPCAMFARCSRDDETVNNVPTWQVNWSAQYELEVGAFGTHWMNGYLVPRLSGYFQTSVHYGPPEARQTIQGAYHLLNGRLGYAFNDDKTEIAIWGKNLTDERYFDFAQNLTTSLGIALRFTAAPRTFGAEVTHRF